ncbi:MAG: hypothetical protein LBV07_05565, partial [Syntrophobacterales bacterium]|nr:hypothetical protein [Syntrophobacterales bacterium]
MKKVLAVLSLLLLVAVFAIPAAAVDVKFSGDYYIAGDYYSRTGVDGHYYGIPDNASTAFFYQSLCIQ